MLVYIRVEGAKVIDKPGNTCMYGVSNSMCKVGRTVVATFAIFVPLVTAALAQNSEYIYIYTVNGFRFFFLCFNSYLEL